MAMASLDFRRKASKGAALGLVAALVVTLGYIALRGSGVLTEPKEATAAQLAPVVIYVALVFAVIGAMMAVSPSIDWLWRRSRWPMILLCAALMMFTTFPGWRWLLFGFEGEPHAFNRAPLSKMLALMVLFGAPPYFAACVRIFESVEIAKGIPWPALGQSLWSGSGKTFWKALGRVLLQAIGLVPVTVVAGLAGVEIYHWAIVTAVKSKIIAPLPPDPGSYDEIHRQVIFAAFVVTGAWWLAVQFLTRDTHRGPEAG